METQLLCTFCNNDELDSLLHEINNSYRIAFGSIYVLENIDVANSLCLTYNVEFSNSSDLVIPESTISLHRKKSTNTLYTINALNMLILELNDGKKDREFQIPWEDYRNMILVTAYNKLKKIRTKLQTIVRTDYLHEKI